jgi:hypothetical protein
MSAQSDELSAESALLELLARLATDAALRKAWMSGEELGHDLPEAARRALGALDKEAFEAHAEGLLAKREAELLRVLPLTRRLCPSIGRRYRWWLVLHPPPVEEGLLGPGLAEGLRALPHLSAELRRDRRESPLAADLLGWELMSGASRRDGLARSWACAHRLDRHLAQLRAGLLPTEPIAGPWTAIFPGRSAP